MRHNSVAFVTLVLVTRPVTLYVLHAEKSFLADLALVRKLSCVHEKMHPKLSFPTENFVADTALVNSWVLMGCFEVLSHA